MKFFSVKILQNVLKVLTSEYELVSGPLTYNQDGLTSKHNCDFMKESRFVSAYNAEYKPSGRAIHWRAHLLCWAVNNAVSLDGDFVECGVDRAVGALTVSKYVDFQNQNKKFYLLDTFTGADEKYMLETEEMRYYPESYEFVRDAFKEYPNVEIIKGAIPGTLPLIKAEKISYLHIDIGYQVPELATIEFLWEKMVSGGIIILNTYGRLRYISLKIAYDDFASKKGVQILSLPTGQGLIIKP